MFWDFYKTFLSLKNYVNVASNRKKQITSLKKKIRCRLEGHCRKQQDSDPDPLPEVRIRGSGSVPKCHGSATLVLT
jgi:hypothetical protein